MGGTLLVTITPHKFYIQMKVLNMIHRVAFFMAAVVLFIIHRQLLASRQRALRSFLMKKIYLAGGDWALKIQLNGWL